MQYIKLLVAIALTAMLAACGGVQVKPLGSNMGDKLQGKTLVVVTYGRPSFFEMTAGKAAIGGLVGAAAMYEAGKQLSIKYDVKDPGVVIRENLVQALKGKYNMKIVTVSAANLESKSMSSIIRNFKGNGDLIFDYKTREMGMFYYPTKWGKYRTRYLARLRLIDSKSKKVIASSNCNGIQGDDKNPPSRKQMMDDNAKLLKEYLNRNINLCTNVIKEKIFNL